MRIGFLVGACGLALAGVAHADRGTTSSVNGARSDAGAAIPALNGDLQKQRNAALGAPGSAQRREHVDYIRQAVREGRLDPRRVTLIDAIDEVVVGVGEFPKYGSPRDGGMSRSHSTGNPNPWAASFVHGRDFHEGFEDAGYTMHVSLDDPVNFRPLAGQVAPNGSTWVAAPNYTGIVDNAIAQTGPNWLEPDGTGGFHGVAGGPDPGGIRSNILAVPRGSIDPQGVAAANLFQARLTHDLFAPTDDEPIMVLIDLYTDNIDSFNWWRPVSFTEGFILTNVFVGGYDFSYFAPFTNANDIADRLIMLGPKVGSFDEGEFFAAATGGHILQDREWMNLAIRISLTSFSIWVRDSTTIGVNGFPDGSIYGATPFAGEIVKMDWYQMFPGYDNDPGSSAIEGYGPAFNFLFQDAAQTPDDFGYPAGPLNFTTSCDALQFIAGGDPTQAEVPGYEPKDSYIDNYMVMGPLFDLPDPTPDEKIPFFDDMELWTEGPMALQGTAWFDFGSAADIVVNQNHTPGGTQSVRQVGIFTDGVYREHYRRRLPRAIADTSTPSVVEAWIRRSSTNQSRGFQPADLVDTGDWMARVIMGGRDDNFLVDNRVYVRVPNPNFDPNAPQDEISGTNAIHVPGRNNSFVNVPLFNGATALSTPTNTWFAVRVEVLDDGTGNATGTVQVRVNGVLGAPDGSVEGITALTTEALSTDSLRFFGGNELSGFLNQMWMDDITVDGPKVLVPTPVTAGDTFLAAQPGFPYTTHPAFNTPYVDDFESYEGGKRLGGQGFAPFLGAFFTDTGGELDVLEGTAASLGATSGVTSVYMYEITDVVTGTVPGGHTAPTVVAVVNNIATSFIPANQPVPGSSVGGVTRVNFRQNNFNENLVARADWILQSATAAPWDGSTPIVGRYNYTYSSRWGSTAGSELLLDVAGGLRDGSGQAIRFQRPGSGGFNSLLPRTLAARSGESSQLAFDLYIHSDDPGNGPRNRITWNVNAAANLATPPQITSFVFGGPNNFEDKHTFNSTTGAITANTPDGLADTFDGRLYQSDPTKLYVLRANPVSGFGLPPFMLQQNSYTVPMNTWVRCKIAVGKTGAWTATFDDGVSTHTVTGTSLQGNPTGSNVRQLERLQFTVSADAGGAGTARGFPIVWTTLAGGENAVPEGGFDPLNSDAGTGSYNNTLKYFYNEIFSITPPSTMPNIIGVNVATGAVIGARTMAVGDVVVMLNDESSAAFGGAPGPISAVEIPRITAWEYTTDGGATRSARGVWNVLGLPGNDGVNDPAPKGGITSNSAPYNNDVPFASMLMASMVDGRNLPIGPGTIPAANIFSINEERYPFQVDGLGDPYRAWVDNLDLRRGGCFGDLTGSGSVGGADMGLLLGAWGTNNPLADMNDSGNVDGADLGLLLGQWGPCP